MNLDDQIVKRAQRGDAAAIDALLRHHYDMVHAICHRIVINSADADDATQMALIAIVRALPSFHRRSSLSTWVYRIATNAALDELRRIRRRPIPTSDAILDTATPDRSNQVDAHMVVTDALAHVAPEFRVVLVLRHIADLEYDDIAAIVGVPIGTVRSRLARGRAQLSDIVGNQPPPPMRQTLNDSVPPHSKDNSHES